MALTQAELREEAAQLSDQAKAFRKKLFASMSADQVTLGMYREASANVSHVCFGLDAARSALSEFMPLDAMELAEAGEASQR